jgi:hypothetical protein
MISTRATVPASAAQQPAREAASQLASVDALRNVQLLAQLRAQALGGFVAVLDHVAAVRAVRHLRAAVVAEEVAALEMLGVAWRVQADGAQHRVRKKLALRRFGSCGGRSAAGGFRSLGVLALETEARARGQQQVSDAAARSATPRVMQAAGSKPRARRAIRALLLRTPGRGAHRHSGCDTIFAARRAPTPPAGRVCCCCARKRRRSRDESKACDCSRARAVRRRSTRCRVRRRRAQR